MKKDYVKPFIYLDVSSNDVIVMSDIGINISDTGWGDFDEGGI